MKPMFWWVLCCAIVLGLFIGWVDTRPTWDDTGITVTAVFVASSIFGVVSPKYTWVWGLAVAGGVVLPNIVASGSYAALVVVPIGLAGSYGGSLLRMSVQRQG